MKHITTTLLLLTLAALRTSAQGICDSVISIAPIPPICQGTGNEYLETSHDWGDFSGPGTSQGSPYLSAENLNPGTYTLTYTITGPGGCTVQATRDFEVLPAFETSAWVQGKIDCSNPNSKVTIFGALPPDPNGVNYNWPYWEGPEPAGETFSGQVIQTPYAGRYKFIAYPVNAQVCPAFAFTEVLFENNPLQINIVSCSNCNTPGGTRFTLDTIPSGWDNPRYSLQVGFFDNSKCRELMEPGLLKATLTNPENGCVSETSRFFSSLTKTPSVSAGSDLGLWCGGAPQFVAATEPKNNDNTFSFFWERPDGTTHPAFWGSTLTVTEPGAYVLRGVNLFTGCETSDVANVAPAPPLIGSEIKVMCDGDSYLGHTQTGNYTDTITLPNGCEKIQFTKIIVLAPLVAEADILPDNGNGTGSIDLTITQGWGPFVYEWSNGETGQDLTGLQNGLYSVVIFDANGCVHEREFEVPAGKPNPKSGNFLNQLQAVIYPNPASATSGQLQILLRSRVEDQGNLMLLDGMGRVVQQSNLALHVGENNITVDKALPEGMYYCVWQNDAGAFVLDKLVVAE
ncbi:MAG: T9SS type A sorting domain-containing protein [Saprospiraceae bacterium]|nr:T9SS type A sorting domain-containing protein [Saprospiraceae bacterium]